MSERIYQDGLNVAINTLIKMIQAPLIERIEALEKANGDLSDLEQPKLEKIIKKVVSNELDDYDPTTHTEFNDAVEQCVSQMSLSDAIKDCLRNHITLTVEAS